MAHFKKPKDYATAPVAVVDPPHAEQDLATQEAEAARELSALEGRLGAAQADGAALDARYRSAAASEVMGDRPSPSADSLLAQRRGVGVTIDGLAEAVEGRRRNLASLRDRIRRADEEAARARLAADFARLARDLAEAEKRAAAAHGLLGAALGRFTAAAAELRGGRFGALRGGMVGEAEARLENLARVALRTPGARLFDSIQVVQLPPEEKR